MKLEHLFRALAVGSVLVAGSCSVANDGNTISLDGARNHPILVEPSYRDLKVGYAGSTDGLSPQDAAKFDAFVADYRVHGNGSLAISVPSGAGSRAAITFFGERAALSGISRNKILVTTREAGNWSSESTRVSVTISPPRERRYDARALATCWDPPRATGHPTACAETINPRPYPAVDA